MVRSRRPLRADAIFNKEWTWGTKVAADTVAADMAGLAKCTKRFAQNVRKNAKSLLNRVKTVRYTAGTVFQNARTKAVKKSFTFS